MRFRSKPLGAIILFLILSPFVAFLLRSLSSTWSTAPSAPDASVTPLPEVANDPKFRTIESRIELNREQLRELPAFTDQDLVSVTRYLDDHDVWQIAIAPAQAGEKQKLLIGKLFSKPIEDGVEIPVYGCLVQTQRGTSLSLDLDPKCTGLGVPFQKKPLGYLSKKVRTGFLLAVRCLSRERGPYVSLNPRCESPEDQYQEALGSILAAEH